MKRNIKALKRLRAVFRKVPAHLVHMRDITSQESCGTVGCLLHWGGQDERLRELGFAYGTGLGLTPDEYCALFADIYLHLHGPRSQIRRVRNALKRDPHAVTKKMVLASLDDAIAGRPIKPYTVK